MTLPPVFLLACNELPERRDAAVQHFRESGVQPVVYRSFHGRSWGVQTVKPYDTDKYISPGHVGLNLGFWSVVQHIYHAGHEEALLFEDDAKLPDNWLQAYQDIRTDLDRDMPDWELVFLGLADVEPHVWNKVTERIGSPTSRLCRMCDPFGTHALLLRRSALLPILDNMAIAERNLDQQLYQRVLQPNKVRWCAVLPSIVTQRTFDYTGSGKVEWQPSCIDVEPAQPRRTDSKPEQSSDQLRPVYDLPTDELKIKTASLIDPVPCIFRGEPLIQDGISQYMRAVPVSQCARLGVACHDKPPKKVGTVTRKNLPVAACQTCDLRKEVSILSAEKRPKLPLPDGHFNPGMVMWRGRLILATRDSWGHSRVSLWHLTNSRDDWSGEWSVSAISSLASDHPEAPRLEDPRLFVDPKTDQLKASFSLPDGYPAKRVKVGHVTFSDDLKRVTETVVMDSPTDSAYEKNWVPFYSQGVLNWVYHTKPEHVVMSHFGGVERFWRTPNNLPWTGGMLRGGCPPVLASRSLNEEPVYYHFMHGCLKRTDRNVYTIGVTVFEAYPPFRVLKQTSVPIVWPDAPGPGESVVKRYVVFPGGAVLHAGAWHVACGVDDSTCRIYRIPFDVVEKALTDQPEQDQAVSLRDTPIAFGFQKENA